MKGVYMNTHNRYNWNEIQRYYNDGHSFRDITAKYGVCSASIHAAKKRGEFVSRTSGESLKLFHQKNPTAGKEQWTSERRKRQSEAKKKLYKEFPEKHPNRKLANNRSKMSYPEKRVYDWLKSENIAFEHQYHIDKYFVDFCIGTLVVEVDSEQFHKDTDYDIHRDAVIESYGFIVKRFPVKSILKFGPSIILDNSISDDIINGYIELRKERICVVCDSIYYTRRKTCSDECKRKLRTIHPPSSKLSNACKQLPVTKEELQELVNTTPMTQIGKQFNVSDNAIRKWCKKYGIETKRKFECTKEELQIMIDSGLSRRAISKEVGVGVDRIQRMLDHYGITIIKQCVKYSGDVIATACDHIDKGLKNIEIAKLMDMDHKQISAIRRRYRK
jgi:very-short-patch-repair endonuclease